MNPRVTMAPFSLKQVVDKTATTLGVVGMPPLVPRVDDDDEDEFVVEASVVDEQVDGVSPITKTAPSEVPTQSDGVMKQSPLRTNVSANSMTEMDSWLTTALAAESKCTPPSISSTDEDRDGR